MHGANNGRAALSKERFARIGQIIGFYIYPCILARLGDVEVPEETIDMLERPKSKL